MSLAPPDDIVAGLRDYGCTVVEWPGWRTNGRPYSFAPYGQAWHHDAFGEQFGDEDAARYMANRGRPDLPAPLANGTVGNFGTVYLTAYGNANHAGRNIASVHDRMRRGHSPASDARYITESDTVVGNSRLWGWECRNAGTGHDPWDQLDVMIRAGAAMCDVNGWSPNANAGHKELTRRKPDPAGFDMPAFRRAIADRLTEKDAMTPDQEKKIHARIDGLVRHIDDVTELARYCVWQLEGDDVSATSAGRRPSMRTLMKRLAENPDSSDPQSVDTQVILDAINELPDDVLAALREQFAK